MAHTNNICLLNSKFLLAQQPQRLGDKVSFDRDSTDWIATVIEKDTVSVLFKMQFEKIAPETLPRNGIYQIIYSSNAIEFNDIKRKKSYAFALSSSTIAQKKRTSSLVSSWYRKNESLVFSD